jgi:hypothetical protein
MIDITPLIVAARVLAFGVGLVVTLAAVRASRRTGSLALRLLAVGSGVITLSTAVGGGLDRALGLGLEAGVLLSSLLLLAGFATLAFSLFVTDPRLNGDDDDLTTSERSSGN